MAVLNGHGRPRGRKQQHSRRTRGKSTGDQGGVTYAGAPRRDLGPVEGAEAEWFPNIIDPDRFRDLLAKKARELGRKAINETRALQHLREWVLAHHEARAARGGQRAIDGEVQLEGAVAEGLVEYSLAREVADEAKAETDRLRQEAKEKRELADKRRSERRASSPDARAGRYDVIWRVGSLVANGLADLLAFALVLSVVPGPEFVRYSLAVVLGLSFGLTIDAIGRSLAGLIAGRRMAPVAMAGVGLVAASVLAATFISQAAFRREAYPRLGEGVPFDPGFLLPAALAIGVGAVTVTCFHHLARDDRELLEEQEEAKRDAIALEALIDTWEQEREHERERGAKALASAYSAHRKAGSVGNRLRYEWAEQAATAESLLGLARNEYLIGAAEQEADQAAEEEETMGWSAPPRRPSLLLGGVAAVAVAALALALGLPLIPGLLAGVLVGVLVHTVVVRETQADRHNSTDEPARPLGSEREPPPPAYFGPPLVTPTAFQNINGASGAGKEESR